MVHLSLRRSASNRSKYCKKFNSKLSLFAVSPIYIFALYQTVLRVWDSIFYEGCKILFRVGITLINYHQKTLLECNSFTTFTDSFKKMQSDIFVLDCHNFMKVSICTSSLFELVLKLIYEILRFRE